MYVRTDTGAQYGIGNAAKCCRTAHCLTPVTTWPSVSFLFGESNKQSMCSFFKINDAFIIFYMVPLFQILDLQRPLVCLCQLNWPQKANIFKVYVGKGQIISRFSRDS